MFEQSEDRVTGTGHRAGTLSLCRETDIPGTRSWYVNLLANPAFTFHVKQPVRVDLPATAIPISDEDQRRELLEEITGRLDANGTLHDWVERSPLVRVEFN
jgi:hypothetical protein